MPMSDPQEKRQRQQAAAKRALAEAEARRKAEMANIRPNEHGGPRGEEPTRYGDWERKGIAVDF